MVSPVGAQVIVVAMFRKPQIMQNTVQRTSSATERRNEDERGCPKPQDSPLPAFDRQLSLCVLN